MLIKVPARNAKGAGRILPCDVCGEEHELGSMIAIESEHNGPNMIKQCCSINCLITVIQNISDKCKPAYH